MGRGITCFDMILRIDAASSPNFSPVVCGARDRKVTLFFSSCGIDLYMHERDCQSKPKSCSL